MADNLIQRVLYDENPASFKKKLTREEAEAISKMPKLGDLKPVYIDTEGTPPLAQFEKSAVYHYSGSTIVVSRSLLSNILHKKELILPQLVGFSLFANKAEVVSENQESIDEAVRYLEDNGFRGYEEEIQAARKEYEQEWTKRQNRRISE